MRTLNAMAVLVLGILVWSSGVGPVEGQVPEIPRPFMGGIARATTRGGQPVIYYNPIRTRMMGPELSAYFRAHEYGHLQLNHLNRNISVQQAEAEADAYAGRTASPAAVAAAHRWFSSGRGGSPQHGSGQERARRLYRGGGIPAGYSRVSSNPRFYSARGYSVGSYSAAGYRVVQIRR